MKQLFDELKIKENEIKMNLHKLYKEKNEYRKKKEQLTELKSQTNGTDLQSCLSRYNEVMKELLELEKAASKSFEKEYLELNLSIQKNEKMLIDLEKAKQIICSVYNICFECEGKKVLYHQPHFGNDPYERKTSMTCFKCKGTGKYVE